MGSSKKTQTQDTQQQFQQTQQQQTQQNQQQLQAQTQASQQLEQLLSSFMNQSAQQQATTGQQTTNQTGTQTAGLSPLQQPVAETYFKDLMAKYTSGGLGMNPYTGPRVAEMTPEQRQAQSMALGFAGGPGQDFANSALASNKMLLDPNVILNPANIPGLAATKEANAQMLTRNLTENQLPVIRNEALLTGGYGGSRQGIAEGLATGRTNEAIARTNSDLDFRAYSQGLEAMKSALGLAPSTMNVGATPATVVGQVGAQNQAQNQAQITAGQQQFQEQQAAPANLMGLIQQLMGTQGQYGGQVTTQQAGTATGTEQVAGTSQQSGQQQQTRLSDIISTMLGISQAEGTAASQGTAEGTSSGRTTTTEKSKPSLLQTIGTIASIFMMPFTFGASAAAIPAFQG